MIAREEAWRILDGEATPLSEVERVALSEALGRVLAEDVASDVAMPPFDRAMMDGFAVRAEDVAEPGARLRVVEVIPAGVASSRRIAPGECARIMTGAPVPAGADAVVMVERTRGGESAGTDVIVDTSARRGENVAPCGQDVALGETVLPQGRLIRPAEVGVLAAAGRDTVSVRRELSVHVLATGDELMAPGAGVPGPGKIRESNGNMLSAQVASIGAGCSVRFGGIVADRLGALDTALTAAQDADVLILSGGVSMGDYDLVGRALKERGLTTLIERVAIKPGKPLLFGRLPALRDGSGGHVFGLPGNPVSSFVTFELFVRPFLRRRAAYPGPHRLTLSARATCEIAGRAMPRCQHLPGVVAVASDGFEVRALEWHGSGDLRGLADANALIVVPAGTAPPQPGETCETILLEPELLRRPSPASRRLP